MRDRLQADKEVARSYADGAVEKGFKAFLRDNSAQVTNTAMNVVSLVVALTVGAIVAAFLLPIGVDELVAVDTTNWSNGADALWGILDVIIVLALFLFFIAVALAAADRA